jgi:hypothetical protein
MTRWLIVLLMSCLCRLLPLEGKEGFGSNMTEVMMRPRDDTDKDNTGKVQYW